MTLDYKYIEQLLDTYFDGETTLEEERILRAFFCQQSLPENLVQYRELFVYEQTEQQEDSLGADFDERMLKLIDGSKPSGTARVISFAAVKTALQPFFRAAAIVTVLITIGNASQALFTDESKQATGVATIEPVSGKNMADMQTSAKDSLTVDSIQILNN